MADPVLLVAADDGLSYERAAVAAHLRRSRYGAASASTRYPGSRVLLYNRAANANALPALMKAALNAFFTSLSHPSSYSSHLPVLRFCSRALIA